MSGGRPVTRIGTGWSMARIAGAAITAVTLAAGLVALPTGAGAAAAHSTYTRTDLVSDVAGVGNAAVQDPNLVNPWGMSDGPTPIWVSNNGKDNSTLYSGAVAGSPVNIVPLVVAIPGGKPTGQVFNGGGGFNVTQGMNMFSSVFIFAGQTGQITGWNPGLSPNTSAVNAVTTPGAVYTGLALATATAGREIYAANFKAGTIDVFDSTFTPVNTSGAFVDKKIPKAFAPYNVAALNGQIFVSYALRNAAKTDALHVPEVGFIDVFTPDGVFVKRLVTALGLNAASGMVIAPTGFGDHTGDLLVANAGSGLVSTYDAMSGRFKGFLLDAKDHLIIIPGLKGLLLGNGVFGDTSAVIFSAGPNYGKHGILGSLALAS